MQVSVGPWWQCVRKYLEHYHITPLENIYRQFFRLMNIRLQSSHLSITAIDFWPGLNVGSKCCIT